MGLFNTFVEKTASAHGIQIPSLNIIPGDYGDDNIEKDIQDLRKSRTWKLAESLLNSFDTVTLPGDYKAFAQTYSAVVWVYVAGWIISSSIGSRDLDIFIGDKEEPTLMNDDPAVELLDEPNEFESGSELIEDSVLFLETTGNGYWEKFKVINGLPSKLFNMEPYFTEMVAHPTQKIAEYLYKPDGAGEPIKFPADEVSHFKYSNPNSIFYGQGAVQPLQNSIVTELFRESYDKTFFKNEARPDIVLKHNPDISKGVLPLQPEARKKVANDWYRAFGGSRRQRLPVLLESGMDISILSEARRDMDFREMEKSLRERIFGAFGVPPAMAGIYEFANYANAKEQIRIFWTVTIPPKCKRIAKTITRSILKPYNKNMWCEFDLTNIAALEETAKEHEERLSRMLERGGISLGEYRKGNGFKIDEKDEFKDKRVMSQNLIPLDDFFMPPVDAEFEEEENETAPMDTMNPGLPGETEQGDEKI